MNFTSERRRAAAQHLITTALIVLLPHAGNTEPLHPWRSASAPERMPLHTRFPPPTGFKRLPAPAGSFTHWLRRLPLMPKGQPVILFNGQQKANQTAHSAVIDIDVGKRDLQQCADAIMRLRAEYLYAHNRFKDIRFNFTDGTPVSFSRWSRGDRPGISGRKTIWRGGGRKSHDRKNFRRYMTIIFAYAGTYSLARELTPVAPRQIRTGDVFIKGGFPGHAVIIADMVVQPKTGKKKFLLIQSYMPAQDMHVLNNPNANSNATTDAPWYSLPERIDEKSELITPEWTFAWDALKRFPD